MRHDEQGILPTVELLESRRLMSTSVFLGLPCLPPPPPTHNPPPTQNPPPPTPNPTPGDGNGQGDDNDQGGHHNPDPNPNPNPNPTPTPPPPVEVVIPEVIGNWSGSHSSSDKSVQGSLSLDVTEPTAGDLSGRVDFRGPQRIRWSGQLLYDAQTGHFTMYYLSSKLVAKFDATLGTDGNDAPVLSGTVEYFTPDGSYTSTFSLLHIA